MESPWPAGRKPRVFKRKEDIFAAHHGALFVFLTLARNIPTFQRSSHHTSLGAGHYFRFRCYGHYLLRRCLLARRFADIALVFVLFAGGFSIKRSDLKPVFAPTMTLATIGVLLTTLVTAIVFHLVSGWTFQRSLWCPRHFFHRRGGRILHSTKSKPPKTGVVHNRNRIGRQRPYGDHFHDPHRPAEHGFGYQYV